MNTRTRMTIVWVEQARCEICSVRTQAGKFSKEIPRNEHDSLVYCETKPTEPMTGEGAADEPTADENTADEPMADEPMADEPMADVRFKYGRTAQ